MKANCFLTIKPIIFCVKIYKLPNEAMLWTQFSHFEDLKVKIICLSTRMAKRPSLWLPLISSPTCDAERKDKKLGGKHESFSWYKSHWISNYGIYVDITEVIINKQKNAANQICKTIRIKGYYRFSLINLYSWHDNVHYCKCLLVIIKPYKKCFYPFRIIVNYEQASLRSPMVKYLHHF